jgi:hypothetical protein
MKIPQLRLERVEFMPKELQRGVLYFAEKYGAAAHLCACGCGKKIRTPVVPTKWKLTEGPNGPTLYPSVGNWQQDCKSHYIIQDGDVIECGRWTDEEILAGRTREQESAQAHFERKYGRKRGLERFWAWLQSFWR